MFTYVPVLRYRQEERAAIKSMVFQKSLPLIEIVSEKPRQDMNGNFATIYTRELSQIKSQEVMVDFPMYITLTSQTLPNVSEFIRPLQANPALRIDYFQQLSAVSNLIPVISYDPQNAYVRGDIIQQERALRDQFPKLAFRLFYKDFSISFADASTVIRAGDILMFDLDTAPHNNSVFMNIYNQIYRLRQKTKCKTVLIRSSLNQDITNVGLIDDQPIPQADNSLLTSYSSYNFDAFGDYAGIKKDELEEKPSISPGVIFYSWHTNSYIGYRGRFKILDEFENHIVPLIINSSYFNSYSQHHRDNCPGCKKILNIHSGYESGKHQGKWKRIAAMHYLYTMEEFL